MPKKVSATPKKELHPTDKGSVKGKTMARKKGEAKLTGNIKPKAVHKGTGSPDKRAPHALHMVKAPKRSMNKTPRY